MPSKSYYSHFSLLFLPSWPLFCKWTPSLLNRQCLFIAACNLLANWIQKPNRKERGEIHHG